MPAELTVRRARCASDDPARTVDEIAERAARGRLPGSPPARRGRRRSRAGSTRASSPSSARARSGRSASSRVLMPEGESASDTLDLSRVAADAAGVETVLEDITGLLEAARLLRAPGRRPSAPSCRNTALAGRRRSSCRASSAARATASSPSSPSRPRATAARRRLTATAYREIVAATNFKQRVRKMLEYYHADRLDYAVVGTPNRLEYDQGFFVKNGDGSADVKPIAHLYKTQVYQLAEALGVPAEIRERPPTTDTYALQQSQEEFYFSRPVRQARPLPLRPQSRAPGRGRGRGDRPRGRDRRARLRGHRAQAARRRVSRMRRRASSPTSSLPRPSRGPAAQPAPSRDVDSAREVVSTGRSRETLHTTRKMSYGLGSSCSPIERRPFR